MSHKKNVCASSLVGCLHKVVTKVPRKVVTANSVLEPGAMLLVLAALGVVVVGEDLTPFSRTISDVQYSDQVCRGPLSFLSCLPFDSTTPFNLRLRRSPRAPQPTTHSSPRGPWDVM
jgi:hypothetical protein